MLQYMYALLFVMLVAFNYHLLKCARVYVSINVYVLEFNGWICYHSKCKVKLLQAVVILVK